MTLTPEQRARFIALFGPKPDWWPENLSHPGTELGLNDPEPSSFRDPDGDVGWFQQRVARNEPEPRPKPYWVKATKPRRNR